LLWIWTSIHSPICTWSILFPWWFLLTLYVSRLFVLGDMVKP
jgi:hypothetical protein